MSKDEIIEGNKLIADFLGCNIDASERYSKPWYSEIGGRFFGYEDCLQFDEKWDWLMPVIEKIEALEVQGTERTTIDDNTEMTYSFIFVINGFQCTIDRDAHNGTEQDFLNLYDCRNKNKIESTYKAVIAFIIWYKQIKTIKK